MLDILVWETYRIDYCFNIKTPYVGEYLNVMNDLFIEVNPIPVKTAMNMMGLKAGPMRLPLCEMSAEHQATLRKTMEEAGLV